MRKATFIDFEDSFSFNVVQELTLIGFDVSVVSWKDFESLPEEGILILGPGPGHPSDYEAIFPLVREWLHAHKPFFGVCLGHQIFWLLQGEPVLRSKEPRHGQRVALNFTPEWSEWLNLKPGVLVQRYNSLAVMESSHRIPALKNFIQDGEILITRGQNIITYQFHPESIGTMCRKAFMRPVFEDLV